MLFVSATEGKSIDKIFRALELVAAERQKRIGTSQMNRFLESVDFEPASVPHRQQVKIFYMTQAQSSPPTFILFTDKDVKLHFAYERFLQNQIPQSIWLCWNTYLDQEPASRQGKAATPESEAPLSPNSSRIVPKASPLMN